jgi:hypothetical protein
MSDYVVATIQVIACREANCSRLQEFWFFENHVCLVIAICKAASKDRTKKVSNPTNMTSTTQPPRQFKQPSRKGKKAWRKNVDITEVQEGLEIVRDEVITGYVGDHGF